MNSKLIAKPTDDTNMIASQLGCCDFEAGEAITSCLEEGINFIITKVAQLDFSTRVSLIKKKGAILDP